MMERARPRLTAATVNQDGDNQALSTYRRSQAANVNANMCAAGRRRRRRARATRRRRAVSGMKRRPSTRRPPSLPFPLLLSKGSMRVTRSRA